ncbi:MAG: iron-containing alcohol dehydrogenase family protein [Bacillota bacterium]|nr:iron-containing alcohol dehydrogenase family protein [Bacillota bacterium]
MNNFRYFMPTDCYFGRGCVSEHKAAMAKLGKKAMVVTGRSSAKKNGAQKDITDALDALGIAWVLFDEIGENPDVETVERAAQIAIAEGVEFFIGIGGGSPMDAGKAISVMAAAPQKGTDALWDGDAKALPIVCVPTTAGTGSEVTQYAILTLHAKKTKSSIAAHIFADVAYLDPKYMDTLPAKTTNNTAVDALTHLIESYLSARANAVSRGIVEMGLSVFRECIPALRKREYPAEVRDQLLLMSALGGAAIAQTMTSLPHGMGYFLTYEKGLAHGMANGVLTQAYVEQFPAGDAHVARLLECLGFADTKELGAFLDEVLEHEAIYTEADLEYYTDRFMEQPGKIATFPYPLTREDIYNMYRKSLMK